MAAADVAAAAEVEKAEPVKEARAAATLAAEDLRQAKAAIDAEVKRQLEAELVGQKARLEELEAEHKRELKRRTGALAERHAQAMMDRDEKHAEEMREKDRQVRLSRSADTSAVRRAISETLSPDGKKALPTPPLQLPPPTPPQQPAMPQPPLPSQLPQALATSVAACGPHVSPGPAPPLQHPQRPADKRVTVRV